MDPSHVTSDAPVLEDRLRGLILSGDHSDANATTSTSDPHAASLVAPAAATPTPSEPATASAPAKSHKKRPNQAQRRQMNSQLVIPLDPRPSPPAQGHRPGHSNPRQTGQQPDHWRSPHQSAQQRGPPAHPRGNRGDPPQHHTFPHSSSAANSTASSNQYMPRHGDHGQRQQYVQRHDRHGPQEHNQGWRQRNQHYQNSQANGFSRGINVMSPEAFPSRGRQGPHHGLYNSQVHRQHVVTPEELANQLVLLDGLCHHVNVEAEIQVSELAEKENFRQQVEIICRKVISDHELSTAESEGFSPDSVRLECFGSLMSGFATKAADMDLGLISPSSVPSPDSSASSIPRLVEKALLDAGFGARLLTRTRVPIIKLCQNPDPDLYHALLDERLKWEKGLDGEDEDVDDELADDQEEPAGKPDFSGLSKMASAPVAHDEARLGQLERSPDRSDPHRRKLKSLRQANNQSFSSYCGNAKRLLRQLGGRDVTQSNTVDFSEKDFKVLDDVSEAFMNGLCDQELKVRVQSLLSVSGSAQSQPPNLRSLAGVIKIVEGEMLHALWGTRSLLEVEPKWESFHAQVMQSWTDLQSTRSFGSNPVAFNKEINQAMDRLSAVPSIRLMQLQQEQHETAAQYSARATQIASRLRWAPNTDPTQLPADVRYYIAGIRDEQVRASVDAFAATVSAPSLRAISSRHKALQLAHDYEKAVEKGSYGPDDAEYVKQYTALLRSPPVAHPGQPGTFVVPFTPDSEPLIHRLSVLPDPSKLGPNQPRDRYHDKLEFPKSGVGVQCDVNFAAHLAIHNTALLRCYALTDPRVKQLVLFVKHWARVRDINTPYRGTLSSYGYVLMVMHYLVNVAEPFVCPNLQLLAPPQANPGSDSNLNLNVCQGRDVRFWRDEDAIKQFARDGTMNNNKDSPGALLRGFFEYYAQGNMMSFGTKRGFDWGRDVLSLRTPDGLLSKQSKGWTGAKTVVQVRMGGPEIPVESPPSSQVPDGGPTDDSSPAPQDQGQKPREFKEVRHRYLFAIEDPFEHDHNVARTVTHNGIVSIRDEFRRAWRIIKAAGRTGAMHENLLEDVKRRNEDMERKQFADLLSGIHGMAG